MGLGFQGLGFRGLGFRFRVSGSDTIPNVFVLVNAKP